MHFDVDAGSEYAHAITGTVADVLEIGETATFTRKDSAEVNSDSGYSVQKGEVVMTSICHK